ncbi:hypothetical protein INR49_010696 [Caranx melampygus]|nr:hypothetical protein INR49_010696 [Caranx melampygus]
MELQQRYKVHLEAIQEESEQDESRGSKTSESEESCQTPVGAVDTEEVMEEEESEDEEELRVLRPRRLTRSPSQRGFAQMTTIESQQEETHSSSLSDLSSCAEDFSDEAVTPGQSTLGKETHFSRRDWKIKVEDLRLEMPGLYVKLTFVAAVALAVLVMVRSSPVVGLEPIRCAPCTQEKLSNCPAIPAGCRQVLREPGCGCCMACALEKGASCGVHTAHCGEGLRCTPRPGETRPLHALTRGQGVCTDDLGQEETELAPDDSSLHYLLGLNLPFDHPDAAEGHESIKAKVNAIRNKLGQHVRIQQNVPSFHKRALLGPCHTELHSALDMIASSQQKLGEKFTTFYLPNCDKYGFYKAKQCESSLVGLPARCWCVSPWNGKKIPGSSDLLSDSECHQEVTH